ncbi:hypothetical protein ADU59_02690 [Pararhizobium polonicum]|uniref:Uncharacterized protein n=1 Tax=Pararhizobium polonicum TaxID=1612624 RepID=A0A1C7P5U7_9HYPH|nr:hypothetical protein [Pararhizobium polonicum]OBZ96675.1 hypothetical protein ADU59_02690 [Pararhizobium polonicum]
MMSAALLDNFVALTVLRSSQKAADENNALGFNFSVTGTSGDLKATILDAFSLDKGLVKQFRANFERIMKDSAAKGMNIEPSNGKHNALVETIIANREAFPPEEFKIYTKFESGGSVETTIPSRAAMMGDIFKKKVAEKQETYDAAIAVRDAEPDPELIRLDAMAKVVKSLVLDANDPHALDESSSARLILQQKPSGSTEESQPADAAVKAAIRSYAATAAILPS